MSAAEVIEQIKQLPREEQERVRSFLDRERGKHGDQTEVRQHVADEDFEKIAGKVFEEHDSLFRRLAQ